MLLDGHTKAIIMHAQLNRCGSPAVVGSDRDRDRETQAGDEAEGALVRKLLVTVSRDDPVSGMLACLQSQNLFPNDQIPSGDAKHYGLND